MSKTWDERFEEQHHLHCQKRAAEGWALMSIVLPTYREHMPDWLITELETWLAGDKFQMIEEPEAPPAASEAAL